MNNKKVETEKKTGISCVGEGLVVIGVVTLCEGMTFLVHFSDVVQELLKDEFGQNSHVDVFAVRTIADAVCLLPLAGIVTAGVLIRNHQKSKK